MRAIKFLLFTGNDMLRLSKYLWGCNNKHLSKETHIPLIQRFLNIHGVALPLPRAQIMLFG